MARVHVRFSDWEAVPGDPISFGTDRASAGAAATAYGDGLIAYAKGMAALEKGDASQAAGLSEALDALLWRLDAAKPKKKDRSTDDDEMDQENPAEVLTLLGTISLDLRGNLKIALGDSSVGLNLLQQAVEKEKTLAYTEPPHYYRPEQESLGYAYLKTKQWDKAREAFQEALHERPNSGHVLYGLAQSYAMAGDVPNATTTYRNFIASWVHADSDLPQIKQAKAWLASHSQ
jgi:tetratricopeptide (TPR) repeat protein